MKSPIRYSALAVLLAVALGVKIQAAPTVGPTSPAKTPPAIEPTYPSVLPLTLEVSADKTHELGAVQKLTITAQREGDAVPVVVVGPVDPFTTENTCKRPMPEGLAGCLVNGDATIGTLRFIWEVPQAGTYRFVLSAKRGDGDGVETIGEFELEARD